MANHDSILALAGSPVSEQTRDWKYPLAEMKAFQGIRMPTPSSRKIAGMMIRVEGEHHCAFRLVVVVSVSEVSMLLDQKAKTYS
jgi:hypothetical protein